MAIADRLDRGPLRRTARFALFVLLVFVLSTVVHSFHHHSDGADHSNCPVCAAVNSPAAVGGVFSLDSPQPIAASQAPFAPLRYDFVGVAPLLSRAPPA